MTDIPQDQVEAVARALAAHDSHGSGKFPADHFWAWQKDRAIAAIRVLSPLIAAVERERCATLCDATAVQQEQIALTSGDRWLSECMHRHAGQTAQRIAESIRSVKGAVT